MAVPAAASIEATATVFHALSDPTRLRIIGLLKKGEKCVCELTDALDAAQSRLSFHLKTLKDAGLLVDRRDGRWIYYSLDPKAREELADVLAVVPLWRAPRGSECCT